MARQRNGGNGGARTPDTGKGDGGWPVECTCAVATVIVFLALSKLSYMVSPLFVGSCTALSGMCTPADCTCAFPYRRRELITQDSQICYQCIAELCPEVAEGEETCSTADCECEDPAWFRQDAKISGEPCWQCIRPSMNWTLRTGGSDDKSCIAAVPVPAPALALPAPAAVAEDDAKASDGTSPDGAEAGQVVGSDPENSAAEAADSKVSPLTLRLVVSSNRSDCLSFRYNGAWMVEKRKGLGCLSWQSFGAYWGLADCDMHDDRMRFKKLLPTSDVSAEASSTDMHVANSGDIYCAGRNSSEFCVEVAEHICTAEDDQCSTRPCRCEDLSWQRQELHTVNGSLCYSCAPPMERCTTAQDSCTAAPCDCDNPSFAPMLVEDPSMFPGGMAPDAKCFRCAPQGRTSSFTHMSTMAVCFTVVCFATCLIGGRFLRFPEGVADGATRKARRNRAGGSGAEARGTWSERWAQNLEDSVWGVYDWFCDKPLTFMRPGLRVAEAGLNRLLDICDLVLEPFYCAADFVWDLVAALHEQLVAMVQAARYGGLRGLKAFIWPSGKNESGGGAGGRKGRRKEQYDAEVEEAAASVEGLVAEATKVHLQARSKKPAAGSQAPRQPKGGAAAVAAELVAEAASRPEVGGYSTANLDWDPLGLKGDGPSGSLSPAAGANPYGTGEAPVPIMVQKDESGRVVLSAMPSMAVADARFRAAHQISSALPLNTPAMQPPQHQQQQPPQPTPTPTPTQSRAQRKLQQRRAARAAAGAEAGAPVAAGGASAASAEQEAPAPIDDSWIDEMEQEEKAKSAKKAKKKKANKEAAKGPSTPRATEKVSTDPAPVVAAAEAEEESEEEEEALVAEALVAEEEVAPQEPEVPPVPEVAAPAPAPEQPTSHSGKKSKKAREAAAKARAAAEASRTEEDSKAKRKKESERQSAQTLNAMSAMVANEGGDVDRDKLLGEVMRGLCLLSESEQAAVAESAALLAARKTSAAPAKATAPEPQAAVAESAALLAARKTSAAPAKATAPEPQESVSAVVEATAIDEKARRRPWRQTEVAQVAAVGVTSGKAQRTQEPELQSMDLEELPPGLENFGGGDTAASADPLKKTDGFQERSSWRSVGGNVRRDRGSGGAAGSNTADQTPSPATSARAPVVPQVSQPATSDAPAARQGVAKELTKETPAPASAGNSRRPATPAQPQASLPQQVAPPPPTAPPAVPKAAAQVPEPSRRVMKPQSPPAAATAAAPTEASGGGAGSKGAAGAAAPSAAGKSATGKADYAQVVANWAKKEPLGGDQGRRIGTAALPVVAGGPAGGSAAAVAAAAVAAAGSSEEGGKASGTTEWPELSQQSGNTRLPAAKSGSTLGGASAPEFVPMAMMQQALNVVDGEDEHRGRRRRGGRKRGVGGPSDVDGSSDPAPAEGSPDWITTVMISGIPSEYTPQSFKEQLDLWGLLGCYNLFLMPADRQTNLGFGYALVNFIDPAFAMLCQWLLLACQFGGASAPAETQGLEACIALAGVYAADENMNAPVAIISEPVPSQWAVNATNELLSPQYRGQFRKTKMCSFFRKGRCTMGSDCPFAHSTSELQQPPDLSHTKLCYNHFRGKCTDEKCRYAHGSHKLRTVKALEHETAMWAFDPASMWGMPGTGWPMMGGADFHPSPETLLSVLTGDNGFVPDQDSEEDGSDDVTSHRGEGAGGLSLAPAHAKVRGSSAGRAAHTGEVVEGIRERGTFMEALQVKDEEPTDSMRRSWSDSDLPAFRAAMEDMELV